MKLFVTPMFPTRGFTLHLLDCSRSSEIVKKQIASQGISCRPNRAWRLSPIELLIGPILSLTRVSTFEDLCSCANLEMATNSM